MLREVVQWWNMISESHLELVDGDSFHAVELVLSNVFPWMISLSALLKIFLIFYQLRCKLT